MSKSEGQLLEDVRAGEVMLTSALISQGGRPVLARPNDDDPLVYSQAWDQLRRERSLRPSHVVEGGGDASRVENNEQFEYERPYFGPSHVVEGGGDILKLEHQALNQWLVQPKFTQVELPAEIRKKELKQEIADCEHYMLQDSRFFSFVWRLKYMNPGPERHKAIEQFRIQVYKERPPEDGTPASRMRDDADPSQKVPEPQVLKAAASQRAPARGQESPAGHPMSTRRASRAGSLRPKGGFGSSDTCVAQGNPSEDPSRDLSLRGGFFP
jgi:hypothetical protein